MIMLICDIFIRFKYRERYVTWYIINEHLYVDDGDLTVKEIFFEAEKSHILIHGLPNEFTDIEFIVYENTRRISFV